MRRITACVLMCSGCALSSHPVEVGRVTANKEVIVAALRVALADATENAAPFEVYCVDAGSSLDADVHEALSKFPMPVVPHSSCQKERTASGWRYVTREGGRRGVRVYAEVSEWRGSDAALVSYGWEQYELAARLCSAEMAKRDGEWIVRELVHCIQA